MERRLNVCSSNWCCFVIDVGLPSVWYVWITSVWYLLVPNSFTSYSRTDTNSLEYCAWLNSNDNGGGGNSSNNGGRRGEIDSDGGNDDDGGDGGGVRNWV